MTQLDIFDAPINPITPTKPTKTTRTIRIYGYCAKPRNKFKIWFDIEINGQDKESMYGLASREAKRLNKLYRYHGRERIASMTIKGKIVEV